jgi:hypothetical protein
MVVHHIPLKPGSKPIQMYQYQLSPHHCEIIQEYIKELLELRHIKPSKSPWRFPLLVMVKKDGKPRVVEDLRGLNLLTIFDSLPMAYQKELIQLMATGYWFTTMDLTSGYHHVWIAEEDKEKTAFAVPGVKGNLYQWKVMPFRLKGAPATFQRLMNNMLKPVLGKFAVVYIDNIGIYSQTKEEHLEHLCVIFDILRKNEMYARKLKCYFMQQEVPYLGHIIIPGGYKMNPAKVQTIIDWPAPKTLKELQSFLGLVNFYRDGLNKLAEIALPMTKLLKKDTKFDWTPECSTAMKNVIAAVTSAPILQTPDYKKKFTVTTDASDQALGAVISQDDKPIEFLSKKFSQQELNWTVHEKETFAMVYAINHWRYYLQNGIPFEVVTDNMAVTYIQTQTKLSPKQARWMETLGEFDFIIQHKPGLTNIIVDAIS